MRDISLPPQPKGSILRLLAVLFVALLIAAVVWGPRLQFDPAEFQALLAPFVKDREQSPFTFALVYFTAYVAITALCIPLEVPFAIGAGALFGLIGGVFIASFASVFGATLAFLGARFLLREPVERLFGKHLKTVNEGVARDGVLYLVNLRLLPIVPFSLCNPLMGLTKMRTAVFYAVSQTCMIFATIVFVNAGTQLNSVHSMADIISPGFIAGLAALALLPWLGKGLLQVVRRTPIQSASKGWAGLRASAGGRSPGQRSWITDFAWENGQIVIRKTGIRLSITWALANEVFNWAIYLAILNLVAASTHLRRIQRKRIWFAPDCPRAWYLVRGAAMWSGIDRATSSAQADAALYFDDSTCGAAPPVQCARCLNQACTNITKSYVAQVFEEVFHYPLSVDPMTAKGEIVEKPEKNGVHGGRIVIAPLPPKPGYTYQRVVDTRDEDGCCRDLRTPCAGGVPVVVWIKVKTPQGRFSINNRRAMLAEPAAVYSPSELELIRIFSERMGLDWGGLDILRDRTDGRIYIVDVNKTDLGPVIALSWHDKIVSMRRLARALRQLVS